MRSSRARNAVLSMFLHKVVPLSTNVSMTQHLTTTVHQHTDYAFIPLYLIFVLHYKHRLYSFFLICYTVQLQPEQQNTSNTDFLFRYSKVLIRFTLQQLMKLIEFVHHFVLIEVPERYRYRLRSWHSFNRKANLILSSFEPLQWKPPRHRTPEP